MRKAPPMPEPVNSLVLNFIGTARGLLEDEGRVCSIAWIGYGQQVTPLMLNDGESTPDQAADHIAKVAATLEADFIFTIGEAWMLGTAHASKHASIVEKYGSVAESPYGVEVVTFQLEMHQGTWTAYVPQKPVGLSKKKKTFGEVEFIMADRVSGRFANLLPSKPKGATMQ